MCQRLIDERGAEVSPYKLAETWNQMAWAHWYKGDRVRAIEVVREGLARHGGTVRAAGLRRTLARFEQEPLRASAAPPASDALPRIGSRVRIQARTLAPGWHEGMWNRMRIEPPCYLVMIFKPRATPAAAMEELMTVAADDIAELEVFTGPVEARTEWIGRPSAQSCSEQWRVVPLDVLGEGNALCRRNLRPPSS